MEVEVEADRASLGNTAGEPTATHCCSSASSSAATQ